MWIFAEFATVVGVMMVVSFLFGGMGILLRVRPPGDDDRGKPKWPKAIYYKGALLVIAYFALTYCAFSYTPLHRLMAYFGEQNHRENVAWCRDHRIASQSPSDCK